MKILIAGDGKAGASLIEELSSAGHDITVIDSKESVLENSLERFDVMTILGNCASMNTLKQAGVEEADMLITMTNADEINLLSCMTAHGLNPSIHTIARIRDPEYIDQVNRMRELFSLSMMVNPEKEAAVEAEHLLRYPGFVKRETFAKGRVEIVELRVKENSSLCGIGLRDLNHVIKAKVLVCGILRGKNTIVPDGSCVVQKDDKLYVTGSTEELTKMMHNLGMITRKAKRVMICGGGRSGFYLAQQLENSGISVKLVEQDLDRCRELAETLPGISIIHGNATKQYLMESEGIEDCDAVISMADRDELNIVISLYARSYGVPQCITKIGHLENSRIIDDLELGGLVYPQELCTNDIVRYVRAIQNQTGAAISVHKIAEGKMEALEFRVDDKTKHCGEPLKSLSIKPNVLISCITHEGVIKIPGGDSSFSHGDTVIVVSNGKNVINQLNDIFKN